MLYGRASEQAAIAGLLDQARGGRAGALVIRGPAGAGKSASLDYAERLATGDAGAKVLRVTGLEPQAQLPYAALHLLLRPALAAIDTLPGPFRALRAAVPREQAPRLAERPLRGAPWPAAGTDRTP